MLRHLRAAARALRHTPDRLLHTSRRRRTTGLLEGAPVSVLFVCYGNICRSPFAAEVYRRLMGDGVRVESAGFIGPGRPMPERGQLVATRRGYDLGAHRSQVLTPDCVAAADLIVVMEERQRRAIADRFKRTDRVLVLGDVDPDAIDTRTVRDPWGQSEQVFDDVFDRIERCVREMVRRTGAQTRA